MCIRKKRVWKFKRIGCLVMAIFMVLATCTTAQASDVAKKAVEAKQGIVQVNTVFSDSNSEKHVVIGGTGFIIGDESGTEYVITCNHIVNPSEEVRNLAFEHYGITGDEGDTSRISCYTEVVVESDVVLNASIVNTSNEMDLAVLQLSQPIYTRKPLTILSNPEYNVEDLPYGVADSVYALGFPGYVNYESENIYYDNEQVAISAGSIVNLLNYNGVQVIESDATVAENNCGGPLVDKNGYVVGMNLLTKDGIYSCALDSTRITKVLDGLGITYSKETQIEEEETEENGPEVEDETENPYTLVIIIVAIVVAVMGITALVTLVIVPRMKRKSKEKKEKKEAEEYKKQQINSVLSQYMDEPKANSTGLKNASNDLDTQLLGGGSYSEETNVLGARPGMTSSTNLGVLVRSKTGERIILNKPYFTIGKDNLHVDYCIKDNSTISRQHAIIRQTSGNLYVEDCNSTNGTWVNENRVASNRPERLRSGDVIKLSNEEFTYQL